jgi:uncharacterized protein YdiU (UPF0061 family)
MTLHLDHRFADALPELALDWRAEAAPDPRLLALDEDLAREIGLDPAALRTPDGLRLLTGEQPPEGARPVAQGYAGHQFGGYSPRLGDGRALLLGELTAPDGRLLDLHLKGSGRTPWSRGGDGLAVVGPMLREHLVSAAMHALGVPTTRSLGVVGTGRVVQRDTPMPGAVLARVAASHLRVGTVQYAAAHDAQRAAAAGTDPGDDCLLARVVTHAAERHHPEVLEAEVPALALLERVVEVQARLVAPWMSVGFVHGVMNTDNVTLSGETIDYGPCAFLDGFDQAAVFSSIDTQGRYAFGQQPAVMQWNLTRLAEGLLPLVTAATGDQDKAIARCVEVLERFPALYGEEYAALLAAKVGLPPAVSAGLDPVTRTDLVGDLLSVMAGARVDHTGFFRDLARELRGQGSPARDRVLDLPAYDAWAERWRTLGPDPDAMDRVNPVYVPRNHLLQEALDAADAGDLAPFDRMLEVVTQPFEERPEWSEYALPDPAGGPFVTYCGT